MEQTLNFKERLLLYKTAKKPRKQIRLKLQMITSGLNLPKIEKCSNKMSEVFKIRENNKIEPQINEYAGRQIKFREESSRKIPCQNMQIIKYKNKVESLRNTNYLFAARLKLNSMLSQITREVDNKSETILSVRQD